MKNKLYFIIVATLLCPTSLYAQSGTDKRSVLSFQTGPTLYTGKLIGIAGYSSNLRNGIGWSGSYTYLVGNKPAIRAGFGILYQGSRYTNDMPNRQHDKYHRQDSNTLFCSTVLPALAETTIRLVFYYRNRIPVI